MVVCWQVLRTRCEEVSHAQFVIAGAVLAVRPALPVVRLRSRCAAAGGRRPAPGGHSPTPRCTGGGPPRRPRPRHAACTAPGRPRRRTGPAAETAAGEAPARRRLRPRRPGDRPPEPRADACPPTPP